MTAIHPRVYEQLTRLATALGATGPGWGVSISPMHPWELEDPLTREVGVRCRCLHTDGPLMDLALGLSFGVIFRLPEAAVLDGTACPDGWAEATAATVLDAYRDREADTPHVVGVRG